MRSKRLYAGLIAIVAACSNQADTKSTNMGRIEIDPNPSCPKCRIDLEPVVTLKAIKDFVPSGFTAVDSRGRWLTYGKDYLAGIYEKDGRFLQIIGRKGRGPGEYVRADHIGIGIGDSILINDGAMERISVFTPAFEYVRSFRSDVYFDYLVQPGGKLVGTPVGRTPKLQDMTTGETLLTFDFGPAPDAKCRPFVPTVQPSKPGRFWSAANPMFRLTEFDLEGHRLREVVFKQPPAWYDPCMSEAPDALPFTPIHMMWYDDAKQRLWVWGTGPGEGWNEYTLKVKQAGAAARTIIAPFVYHIMVIDLRARRVLMETTLKNEDTYLQLTNVAPYITTPDDESDAGGLKVMRAVVIEDEKTATR
jgi:hypothetical protein